MARTDIWGWPTDHYGRSWDLTERNFGAKLIEDVKAGGSSFQDGNEIISPIANGPEWIARVATATESDRTAAIDFLKSKDYTPPNGMSLEDFVVCSPQMRSDLLET